MHYYREARQRKRTSQNNYIHMKVWLLLGITTVQILASLPYTSYQKFTSPKNKAREVTFELESWNPSRNSGREVSPLGTHLHQLKMKNTAQVSDLEEKEVKGVRSKRDLHSDLKARDCYHRRIHEEMDFLRPPREKTKTWSWLETKKEEQKRKIGHDNLPWSCYFSIHLSHLQIKDDPEEKQKQTAIPTTFSSLQRKGKRSGALNVKLSLFRWIERIWVESFLSRVILY